MINVYIHPHHERTCQLTLEKLKARHLPYRTINRDNEAAIDQFLITQGYAKSPVVEIPGKTIQRWSGYRPDLIDKLAINQAHHG